MASTKNDRNRDPDDEEIIMTATATLTPAELADLLGTDSRTTRKFLRSITPRDEQPGKGSRWAIPGTKSSIATLTKKYAKWVEAQEAARVAREAANETNEDETPNED
jgi:hypothetical protein